MEEKWLAQLSQVIVKEQFGEVAEEAVENLLKFGPQKYDDLKRMMVRTKPTDGLMRDMLSVLIQHAVLRYRSIGAVKVSGTGQSELHPVVYSVDANGVFNRLKFPRYISLATNKFGDIAGLIMCVILENGVISYEKIISIITSKLIQDYGEDENGAVANELIIADKVKQSFAILLKNHFVIKASQKNRLDSESDPDYNPDDDDDDDDSNNIFATKRKRKNDVKSKKSNNTDDDVTGEKGKKRHRKSPSASPSPTAKRSPLDTSELMFVDMLLDQKKVDEAAADSAAAAALKAEEEKKRAKKSLKDSLIPQQEQGFFEDTIDTFVPRVASTAKDGVTEIVKDGSNSNDNGIDFNGEGGDDEMGDLWQINFKFLKEYENKTNILKFITDNFGRISSRIVKVMLSMGSSRAIEVDDLLAEVHRTATIALAHRKKREEAGDAMSDVFNDVMDDDESEEELLFLEKMEQGRLNVSLEVMAKSKLCVLTKLRNVHDPTLGLYVVQTGEIEQNIKNRTIESIIMGKFGQIGLRIYRILRDKKMIEHFQITEIAKIPSPETTLDILYKFLSWGYVSIQELPKSFRDPATSVFLWHVDDAEIEQKMANEVLHTILNFKLRAAAERERISDLLTKAETEKMLPPSAPSVLSDEEKTKLDKFYMKQERLEIAIIEMIDTLMKLKINLRRK